MKTPAHLPEFTANQLKAAYDNRHTNERDFLALVSALRCHSWPLRSIGDAMGVSRTAIYKWERKALEDPQVQEAAKTIFVPKIPVIAHGSKVKTKKIKKQISQAEVVKLTALAESASKVTRWTRTDSPDLAAAQEYERLLTYYVDERGIPSAYLARLVGVTRRAIMQRVEKERARRADGVQ